MGDGFYRSKNPTNSIKVLKEHIPSTQITQKYNKQTYKHKTQIAQQDTGWRGINSLRLSAARRTDRDAMRLKMCIVLCAEPGEH